MKGKRNVLLLLLFWLRPDNFSILSLFVSFKINYSPNSRLIVFMLYKYACKYQTHQIKQQII